MTILIYSLLQVEVTVALAQSLSCLLAFLCFHSKANEITATANRNAKLSRNETNFQTTQEASLLRTRRAAFPPGHFVVGVHITDSQITTCEIHEDAARAHTYLPPTAE